MSERLVRQIFEAARDNTITVMNEYHRLYKYNRRTSRWARKLENCKLLLGRVRRTDLEEILEQLKANNGNYRT